MIVSINSIILISVLAFYTVGRATAASTSSAICGGKAGFGAGGVDSLGVDHAYVLQRLRIQTIGDLSKYSPAELFVAIRSDGPLFAGDRLHLVQQCVQGLKHRQLKMAANTLAHTAAAMRTTVADAGFSYAERLAAVGLHNLGDFRKHSPLSLFENLKRSLHREDDAFAYAMQAVEQLKILGVSLRRPGLSEADPIDSLSVETLALGPIGSYRTIGDLSAHVPHQIWEALQTSNNHSGDTEVQYRLLKRRLAYLGGRIRTPGPDDLSNLKKKWLGFLDLGPVTESLTIKSQIGSVGDLMALSEDELRRKLAQCCRDGAEQPEVIIKKIKERLTLLGG